MSSHEKDHPMPQQDSTPHPLSAPDRVQILGAQVHRISLQETVAWMMQRAQGSEGGLVVTPNVDHLMNLRKDPEFQEIYQAAALVVADGMPLVWASKLLGKPVPERVAGSDLLPHLCQAAARTQCRVFFLGGQPEGLEASMEKVREKYPDLPIAGAISPPFGFEQDPAYEAQLLEQIRETSPDLLLIGLGSPKQEKFWFRHRAQLEGILCMGVGIGIDFLAGSMSRAPLWMQKSGLEWTHRLFKEPGRLWKRYLVKGMRFPGLVLLQVLSQGRQKARLPHP